MKSNYDFSQAIRGKYTRRYAKGANVVILEPDVAKVFPTSKAVNSSCERSFGSKPWNRPGNDRQPFSVSAFSHPTCCQRTPPIISGLPSDSFPQLVAPPARVTLSSSVV